MRMLSINRQLSYPSKIKKISKLIREDENYFNQLKDSVLLTWYLAFCSDKELNLSKKSQIHKIIIWSVLLRFEPY
jgi:hypothetical protein